MSSRPGIDHPGVVPRDDRRRAAAAPRRLALGVIAASMLVACNSSATESDSGGIATVAPAEPRFRYPEAPPAPDADVPSDSAVDAAIDTIISVAGGAGQLDASSVRAVAESGDARHGWLLADLLRFFGGDGAIDVVDAFESLAGVEIAPDPAAAGNPWLSVTNHLIAWDTPAYPGYRGDKRGLFLLVDDRWAPFFDDDDAAIDDRLLSWGGVLIDDRELGDTEGCRRGCIPALDDPVTTDAAGGDWYPDERIVFGLVEGDEAIAFPKHIAEVHEMFNLTLGGRRFGVPYCTLCGSAQAYYTDTATDTDTDTATDTATATDGAGGGLVLRTSGLLSRSNKVMYDLGTTSVFDTFTGAAVSGPLQDRGVVLEQATIVRSTWGEWKRAHPDTQIVAEDGGIGRTYELDPLQGRDDDGPIFPIGPTDDRLAVQELVVGVIAPDGTPLAFPSERSSAILAGGGDVELSGVSLVEAGDGLRAVDVATGDDVAAHEAFWFAWSQFHPDTLLFED